MYSAEEKKKIDELRQRVKDELVTEEQTSDSFLIRWLRARSMNLDKAEEMLKKSLAWRKETGADTILEKEDFPEQYKKKFMFAVFGEDDDGCPILLLPAGRHNHRMLIEIEGMDACLRWNIVWMEKVMNIIRQQRVRTGKPVYTYHEIIDMERYSYKSFTYKPAIDYILETQRMFDENYPDILKSVTVINAPKIFPLLFALIKPMLPKETLEKLAIYGCDEEAWKEAFRQKGFPMDKFPPRWGGTLKGSDEFCSQESVWVDAPIPLSYFKEGVFPIPLTEPEKDCDGYLTLKVGAREKIELRFPTGEGDGITKIDWKFKTENHDIGFQLSFQDATSTQDTILVPLKRAGSNRAIQEGSNTVNTCGTFIVLFDNRYSYMKSKNLKYQVDISKI